LVDLSVREVLMVGQTSRSSFLSQALRCYETRDWLSLSNLANDTEIEMWSEEDESLSREDNQILNEMAARLREAHGKLLNNQRLSLSPQPATDLVRIVRDHFGRLSPRGQNAMRQRHRETRTSPRTTDQAASEHDELEALDARYARELVHMIPRAVAKASLLQRLEIEQIPYAAVQRYFTEAHRCYLLGLNTACVAVCRAILEAALKDKLGPQNSFDDLLDESEGILDAERLLWANRVRSAGNLALHNQDKFQGKYSDTGVEEILLNTRKIIEDLYSNR
jgi:hypothetical protein